MAQYPHVEWLDLYGDGTLHECAVVKKDHVGNIYYIRLRELDMVDRRRIAKILTGRNASNFALWDLLHQSTLGNGMNALEYFHQYVMVRTPNGQRHRPQVGTIGAAMRQTGVIQAPQQTAQPVQQVTEQAQPARRSSSRTPPPAS